MKTLVLLALLLLAAAPGRALPRGTSGAQFLKLGAGARAGAMADAGVAVEGDAFGLYYNPATLPRLQRPQIGGSHSALFQGITYQTLVYAYPFGRREGRGRIETTGNRHAIGAGIFHLGVADIERRTGDTTTPIGTFNSADAAYALSYAHAFDDRLSVGVTGKYISETLDSYSANAYAADLGALFKLNPTSERPVSIGAAIRNMGSKIGYVSSVTDPLPTTVVVGAAASPWKSSTLALDVTKERDADLFVSFGAEVKRSVGENTNAALRFGYTSARKDNEGLNGVTAGAGLSFSKAAFDFAWIPFGTLGDAFRFSLLIKF